MILVADDDGADSADTVRIVHILCTGLKAAPEGGFHVSNSGNSAEVQMIP